MNTFFKKFIYFILRSMSQSASGADAATTADDLDQNVDGSTDSNDDYQMLTTDYEKGKLFCKEFTPLCFSIECMSKFHVTKRLYFC